MIDLRRINDEVYYATSGVVRFGSDEIGFVKHRAAASPRRRARICAHLDEADSLHEMLIALAAGGYVRPHRHTRRAESFHVVEGAADVVLFDDAGGVEQVIRMGTAVGDARIYRLNAPRFHTVLVRSECFVVHEVTRGPFDPADTAFAAWAPAEGDGGGIASFLADLDSRVKER